MSVLVVSILQECQYDACLNSRARFVVACPKGISFETSQICVRYRLCAWLGVNYAWSCLLCHFDVRLILSEFSYKFVQCACRGNFCK